MRRLLGLLPFAVLALSCTALTGLPEMDWNPLVRVEHAADGAVEVEAFGPFLAVREGPEGVSHAVRPFYQHKADGPDESLTDILPPLGRHFRNNSGSKFRFFPFVWAGSIDDTGEGSKWAGVFFPFILAGNGPEDDDGYFAFFPLAGRTRRVFGIDTFDFVLWPLFMRTHMDVSEESDSWTAFLLLGWTDGGPRDGSWRIFPFYRHRLWRAPDGRLRTDQHTVLWPFLTWGKDHLDTDDPSWRFSFWPLIGLEVATRWRRLTLLWPFFRFNTEHADEVEGDPAFLYDVPWPFIRWERGDERSTFRVFPLYSRQVTPEVDSTSVLFPFGWWREIDGRTAEEGQPPVAMHRTDLYALPFWHRSWRGVEGRAGLDTENQFWPFAHADNGAHGREDWGLLSLVPARNIELLEPVDELWSPFFTLWRHRSDGVRHETRLLFDSIVWRRAPEGLTVSVPFFYSRKPDDDGARHQSFWGALGWGTDDGGVSRLSLFGWNLWQR